MSEDKKLCCRRGGNVPTVTKRDVQTVKSKITSACRRYGDAEKKSVLEKCSKDGNKNNKTPIKQVADSTSLSFRQEKSGVNVNADEPRDKNKTWYDLLLHQNDARSRCDCDKASTDAFCNNKLVKNGKSTSPQCVHYSGTKANECELKIHVPDDGMRLVNDLMDKLYSRLCRSGDDEILLLMLSIKKLLNISPNSCRPDPLALKRGIHFNNVNLHPVEELHGVRCKCDCEDVSQRTDKRLEDHAFLKLINERKKCSAEREESAELGVLKELKRDLSSVNAKTEHYSDSIKSLHKLLVDMKRENEMIVEMKNIKNKLETKLITVTQENTTLKDELSALKQERAKDRVELESKRKEVTVLRDHIKKISNTIQQKSKKIVDVTNFHHCNQLQAVSSSPLNVSFLNNEDAEQKGHRNSKSDDSGIQSNTPRAHGFVASLEDRLSDIAAEIKENLEINDEDIKLCVSGNIDEAETSICLSDVTYKYSFPSIYLN